jgi:hypothetical protein
MISQHYGSKGCGCDGTKAITPLGTTKMTSRGGHHVRARAAALGTPTGGGCG